MPSATDHDAEPVGLTDAARLISRSALADEPVGAVGLEIEGHVLVRGDALRPPDLPVLRRVVEDLPVLPYGGRVTLEPGGQVEVSSGVHPDLPTALEAMRAETAVVRRRLAADGLGWVLLGTDPLRAPRRVNDAERYACMEGFYDADPDTAEHGRTMMCSTASLQVNLQAGRPDQWADRVRRAQRLGPLLTALSGTSRFLRGADTGWHSARQRAWSGLGRLVSGALPDTTDPAAAWVERALAAPVVHVPVADGLRGADQRRSLADWLRDPGDWPAPTRTDVRRHLTTLFPPVRLRGWLELRSLDAVPDRWWPALAAFTVALMDDDRTHAALDEQLARVGGRWSEAARDGLRDVPLARAATAAIDAATPVVPEELRADLGAMHALAMTGRTVGSVVTDDLRRRGPAAVMEELSR